MSGSMGISSLENKQYLSTTDRLNQARPQDVKDVREIVVSQNPPDRLQNVVGPIGEIPKMEIQANGIDTITTKIQEVSFSMLGGSASTDSQEQADIAPADCPTSIQDLPELPLRMILSKLKPRDKGHVAQTDRFLRDIVHKEQDDNLKVLKNHEGLQELLSLFLRDPPLVGTPERLQGIKWSILLGEDSELFEVVNTSRDLIVKSPMITDEEKAPFSGKSDQEIVFDLKLLTKLLQTERDRNLVVFSAEIWRGMPDLSSVRTLSEKAKTVREHFEKNGESSIEWIDCHSCGLTCIPQEMRFLTHLRGLKLSSNKLHFLPEFLGSLKTLRYLLLTDNRLQTLPDIFDGLQKLKILQLSKNNLRFLPESLSSLAELIELSLYGNQLQFLPKSLCNLIALKNLGIDETVSQCSRGIVEALQNRGVVIDVNEKAIA